MPLLWAWSSSVTVGQRVTLTAMLPCDAYGTLSFKDNGRPIAGLERIVVPPQVGSGHALQVPGGSRYIDLGQNPLTKNVTTVSVWINKSQMRLQYIAELMAGGGQLLLDSRGDGTVCMGFRGNNAVMTPSVVNKTDTWYHLVYCYNGGDKQDPGSYAIYVDGVKQPLVQVGRNGFWPGSGPCNHIGAAESPGGQSFTGQMRGFAIYSARVSQSNVDNLYKHIHGGLGGSGRICDALVVGFQTPPENALQFPAGPGYIGLGQEPLTKNTTTVSVWINKSQMRLQYIAELMAGGGRLLLYSYDDGTVCMGFRGATEMLAPSVVNKIGTWYHLVFCYNGGDKESPGSYGIFVDGVKQPLVPGNRNGFSGSPCNHIGAAKGGVSFPGQMPD